nr:CopG family transcriptional regulator [uncultured Agrobacterium sp.]
MKTISAEEFDRKFDQGEDIDEYLDWSTARHAGLDLVRVDINLPRMFCVNWMEKRRALELHASR